MKPPTNPRESTARGGASRPPTGPPAAMDGLGFPWQRARVIPRVIYQTWRTKDERAWKPAERRWVASWRKNDGWRHELHDDDDCLAFVRARYPEHVDAYLSLKPVEKADLWRYMIVHTNGGLYSDFDAACAEPIDRWLRPDDELVLGLMTDVLDEYPTWRARRFVQSGGGFDPTSAWRDYPVIFTNWTFAARAGHPLLADVIRRVAMNAVDPYFLDEDPAWTVKKTGPGALTDAVNDYLAQHGASANDVARRLRSAREVRVGGARLLDYASFHTRHVTHYGMRSWGAPRRGLDWLLNRLRVTFG